jgi:bifunctional ADP-heptose synthase (sugar kinase/adenylyltransferase)
VELRCVDYVVDFDENTATELLRFIRPDIVVKGADYNLATTVERSVIDEVGARLLFADYIPGISSTRIVEWQATRPSACGDIHLVTDLALDTYVNAEASTLSREFPAVVCLNPTERSVLGGGGNLAVSLKRQSALSSVIGVVGASPVDVTIQNLMLAGGIDCSDLATFFGPYCTQYRKVVARRQGSGMQELLRLDEVPARTEMGPVWKVVQESILRKVITKGDVIVASAYEDSLRSTVGPPIRAALRDIAVNRGATLIGACRHAARSLVGFDIIVVNEQECFEALSQAGNAATVTNEAVQSFASLVAPSSVVVTLGERGAMVCSTESAEIVEVGTRPCPPGTDPTGAGDVFLAAFAGAVSRGRSVVDATVTAVRCATNSLFNAQRPAVAEHHLPSD